jgi:hypothetical protein
MVSRAVQEEHIRLRWEVIEVDNIAMQKARENV